MSWPSTTDLVKPEPAVTHWPGLSFIVELDSPVHQTGLVSAPEVHVLDVEDPDHHQNADLKQDAPAGLGSVSGQDDRSSRVLLEPEEDEASGVVRVGGRGRNNTAFHTAFLWRDRRREFGAPVVTFHFTTQGRAS